MAEMLLIDLDSDYIQETLYRRGFKTRQDIEEWLNNAPTIDAVPVVRCKYCIRRYDTDECPMCFLIEGKYYEYTNENGFCDRGDRKEGADNG